MLHSSPLQLLIFVAFIQYHMSKIQETDPDSTSTWQQNKLFENALADVDENAPDRWQNIAKATGMTVEEVKSQYQKLVEDLDLIESDLVPLPNYENYEDDNPKPEP